MTGRVPAATPNPDRRDDQAPVAHSAKTMSDPDVVLQIPYLTVRQLCAEVDDLDAHVSLRARLGSLLQLDVGVQARLGTVRIDIEGVETEAMLEVRLDEVRAILDRAVGALEHNPRIVESLPTTGDTTPNRIGQTAEQALGPQAPTRQQTGQQVGQAAGQLGQQVGQAAGQQVAESTQQPGRAAAGGGGDGTSRGSPARAAWQRMKQLATRGRPARQVTPRRTGARGQGQQRDA